VSSNEYEEMKEEEESKQRYLSVFLKRVDEVMRRQS